MILDKEEYLNTTRAYLVQGLPRYTFPTSDEVALLEARM